MNDKNIKCPHCPSGHWITRYYGKRDRKGIVTCSDCNTSKKEAIRETLSILKETLKNCPKTPKEESLFKKIMKNQMYITLTVTIPEKLYDEVVENAKKAGIGEIVIKALEYYFEENTRYDK